MKRFLLLLFLVTFFLLYRNKFQPVVSQLPVIKNNVPVNTATPTPKIYKPIDHYNPPSVKSADSYTLIFIGDSMTAALGENFDELRKNLSVLYPNKVFGLFNYGYGSTNLFSIEERLDHDTNYLGKTMPAINGRYFDVIIIESFAYNPLSQYNLQLGLTHQEETLNHDIAKIVDIHPDALVILLATIAPSKQLYAQGVENLSKEQRKSEAEERIAYMENFINYAHKHNYPLINVYEKSLDKDGNAISKYINAADHIHPSAEGIKLISQTIADYFNSNNIFPH